MYDKKCLNIKTNYSYFTMLQNVDVFTVKKLT